MDMVRRIKVLSRPPKKDKGLTRLLLLLIAIPFVLCILLILAVGMALQNNIANLANGIIIVSTKMFKKGETV